MADGPTSSADEETSADGPEAIRFSDQADSDDSAPPITINAAKALRTRRAVRSRSRTGPPSAPNRNRTRRTHARNAESRENRAERMERKERRMKPLKKNGRSFGAADVMRRHGVPPPQNGANAAYSCSSRKAGKVFTNWRAMRNWLSWARMALVSASSSAAFLSLSDLAASPPFSR